jgi:16S rRNA G966 N2-methylase RsmD
MNYDYPYYKLFYKFNKKRIKQILLNFKPIIYNEIPSEFKHIQINKFNDSYFFIKDKWKINEELNRLTDYFTEKYRVKCQFANFLTPFDYWNNNKQKIINSVKNDSLENLNNYLSLSKYTKFCNNFRVSVCLAILLHFKPKKWLDISAGWGDRLISAIFYNVDLYCAVDPNKDLHKGYKKIIKKLCKKKNRNKFILIEDGFETATLPDTKFDLVFSSPPFFDLEKYSKYENDSLVKYNQEKSWTDNFLMPSIFKAIDHLEINGYMILHIHYSPYVAEQFKQIKLKYLGMIYFYDHNPRGISVWQKL